MHDTPVSVEDFPFSRTARLLCGTLLLLSVLAAAGAPAPGIQGEILATERAVDFGRRTTNWTPAAVGQQLVVADRLRTKELSRAMLQLAELGRVRVNELTTLEVLPPPAAGGKATFDLKGGALYFFTRDKPREFQIQTPHALAASRGTEFLVTIEPAGRVVFTVFDGEVELSNPQGTLVITNGEQGAALAGQAPFKLAAIQAVNIVQWWLYYPGVLDIDEVPLTAAEQAALAASINSYRQGDLLAAMDSYPAGRVPQSDAEKAFYSGLLLAVGQVDKAETQLATAPSQPALVNALREVINAVRLTNASVIATSRLASEWLAKSYFQQAQFDLRGALESARAAVKQSTNFGFAWERIAELEFSFGHTDEAIEALDKALQLSPRNAQAWALKGFLAAAKNQLQDATNYFQTAIDLDRALGNGWLGRGLVRIRTGDETGGRIDLQTAAAMEPNRSLLRSYLAKAFDNLGEVTNAAKELRLAKRLDPEDPTPWLYSALLLRQELRFNEAIDDLEKSLLLNTNRSVYRSRLLLDQDQAVRSSSLATIYRSAGMNEVSVREAARAVTADYGNPSAHLFLAESFDALRDPTRFNLRIETAWFNELLLANLLAPVGGGNLSQNISQQEYSRLFEGNRLGLSTFSEYRSDGQFRELASQFGTYRNTSYALDLDYQHNDGVRPNNELDRIEWYTTLKHQLTPEDSVLFLAKYQDYHSGDNFQYYDPKAFVPTPNLAAFGVNRTPAYRPAFEFDEFQHPQAVMGYHHEWRPGIHTLALGGRLENDQRFSDKFTSQRVVTRDSNGLITATAQAPLDAAYRSELEIYTAELNQIIQGERFHLVVGSRFQTGTFKTADLLTVPRSLRSTPFTNLFAHPPARHDLDDDFERITGYAYYTLKLDEDLYVTAGLAYDRITFPENHRIVPISAGTTTRDQVGPKAAVVWTPRSEFTLRGAYAQALGGVSLDESFRLEPVQLAGFNQAFRSIISESVPGAGSVSAPTYEVGGLALDMKFPTRTYVGLLGEVLNSQVRRRAGVFADLPQAPAPGPPRSSGTPERLDYDERSASLTIHQLLSEEWSFGTGYRFTQSELDDTFPLVPSTLPFANRHQRANLQEAKLFLLYNHPRGFFARAETLWFHQDTFDHAPKLASEDFFQQNLFIGYRLRRQRGEISVGVLNLNDTDYRLNPLNLYAELPRERTFVARLKINL